MGESIVDSSSYEDKVAETASSDAALEVSVSFGRFENDSLSWERFSTFSPNKYLEEVEKCATPGSVAEKRAYFEAHYKKIAARKAELMDQAKQMENDNLRSPHDQSSGDLTGNSFGTNFHYDTSNSQDSAEAVEQETNSVSEVSSNHNDEAANGDASVAIECQSLGIGVKEELGSRLDSPKFDKSEEVDLVRDEEIEEARTIESKDIKELPQKLDNDKGNAVKTKEGNLKSDRPKQASRKITAVGKEKNTPGVKKKPASPITKTPQFSTPRTSKPAPTKAQQLSTPRVSKSVPTKTPQFSTPRVSKPAPAKAPQFSTPRVSKPAPTLTTMTASRSSIKKENGSSLSTKKNPSSAESKRVAPKSLHMSLRIDPATPARPDPVSDTTTRKSLIMERMGDKDIVKRAFKTFQNNLNQLKAFSEERSSVPEQASTRGAELRVPGTMTTRKDNGRSINEGGLEKRSAKAAPSSFGLKNNERAQKHKELSKKLEEKSNTRLQPKSKEQKEAEMKRLITQSLDLKASPMSGLYRGKKISTGPSH